VSQFGREGYPSFSQSFSGFPVDRSEYKTFLDFRKKACPTAQACFFGFYKEKKP
jgi:hypothetical protein